MKGLAGLSDETARNKGIAMHNLSADRVVLREMTRADLPTFFEHQLDPPARHMAAFAARDPADRETFATHWDRVLGDPIVIKRTILFDGKVAGNVMCFEQEGNRHVCYWIGREYWGLGIATEALREFLSLVKERPLFALAARDNFSSIRVLEKCGFEISRYGKGFASARGQEIAEVMMRLA